MLFSHHDLHSFIANYGYWAVAFFVALESMGLPLPGETILILAAGYAGSHNGNIVVVIASAAIGAIIGDNVGYLAGRELGSRFLQRYGPMIGLTAARIKLGQYFFMRYGSKIVFRVVHRNTAVPGCLPRGCKSHGLAQVPRRQRCGWHPVCDSRGYGRLFVRKGAASRAGSNRRSCLCPRGPGSGVDFYIFASSRS